MRRFLSPVFLYKLSGVVFLLFAVGHTIGFLTLVPPTEEGRSVFKGMNSVRFEGYSYGDFYLGFGLLITACQLFFAVMMWQLAKLSKTHPVEASALGWSVAALQAVGVVLGVMYLVPPSVVTSMVLVVI